MRSDRLIKTAGVLAVAVLFVSLAAPYLGGLLAERAVANASSEMLRGDDPTTVATDSSDELLDPLGGANSGVRPLPLRADGELVDQLLTTNVLLDADAIRRTVFSLAGEIGLVEAVGYGLSLESYEVQSEIAPDGSYRYEPIDSVLADQLSNITPDDEDAILDLSAGLIAMAGADGGTQDHAGVTGAAIAYSLLRQVPFEASCDLLTNLAYVTGLGVRPATETVESATQIAETACGPGDPTPAWAQAKYLASIATVGPDDPRSFVEAPSERRKLAQASFQDLQTSFPKLPIGWAGEADLLLGWAEASDAVGAQPFQSKEWRETALELLVKARRVSTDARLVLGQARALLGLGRIDEARLVLGQAEPLLGDYLPLAIIASKIESASGDYSSAVEGIRDEQDAGRPWWTAGPPLIDRADYLTGSYAVEEYPPVMVFDAAREEFGGASVSDFGFLPTSRREAHPISCWGARLFDQLLLADDAQGVLALLDSGVLPTDDWSGRTCGSSDFTPDVLRPETYRAMALTALDRFDEAADVLFSAGPDGFTGEPRTLADPWERLQDLFRSAEEFDAARDVADEWQTQLPDDPLALQRHGEVDYLTANYPPARDGFTRAARMWRETGAQFVESGDLTWVPSERDNLILALLQTSATEYEIGADTSAALQEAKSLTSPWDPAIPADTYSDLARLYILQLEGQIALDREDWEQAVRVLAEARSIATGFASKSFFGNPATSMESEENVTGLTSGATENNLALAYSRLGKTDEAVTSARAALSYDPANPVYLDTLGFALQKNGEDEAAVEAYENAEAADESSFVSTTNRAVGLAKRGEQEDAEAALLRVVAAHPDYALGWHNLGVVWAQSIDPLDDLRAQGALGKAARLDANLRGGQDLMMDDEIYRSGLDVSRVETQSWRYGTSAAAVTERMTWSVVILIFLRGLWVLGLDHVTGRVSGLILAGRFRSWRWWTALLSPHWALLATVALLGGPLLWGSAGARGLWALTAVAGLVVAPLLVRSWVASRRGGATLHRGWTPALVTGAVGSVVGLSFAPYPVLDDGQRPSGAVRWAAPLVLATLGFIALLVTWTTGAPLPRVLAAHALVILASMLMPIAPLDGAALRNRRIQAVITLLLAAGTLGLALQWV